jgi:F-box and leucine-rich repeat protein GRR1
VDISKDVNITEKSINAMAENCKRLQGLNISGCENISNESLINLAQNCRYIKRVRPFPCPLTLLKTPLPICFVGC